ncbi:MAG: tRNA lysidine(34) synthetase TilS, partial [Planctomycetota bacterium]
MSESATTQRHPSWLQLKQQLEASWPSKNRRSVGVVVGCSGGADSIALLRCLAEIRNQVGGEGFLVAAHFNHRLRGEASDGDERFVSDAASVLNVSFVSESNQSGGGAFDEATLRNQRYAFFRNTLQRTGARYLALAHSADDNVETVLHHFMRGTGPAGLTGMSAFREFGPGDESDFIIARPLLRCRRELIRAALREREQSWREDASNTDDRYSRNWIRRQLLPLIESRYPVAIESITR